MKAKARFFEELSVRELYEILRARAQVFVVEQTCIYQDLDGKDIDSLHLFYEEDGKVVAYLRAFAVGEKTVQIGRVLTVKRGVGLGGRLLKESLQKIRECFQPETIVLEAQCTAVGFYEREGFEVTSEPFLEDGIPHVQMRLCL